MAGPQWVLLNACLDTTVELAGAVVVFAVVLVVVCLVCNLWATCASCFKCAACVYLSVFVYFTWCQQKVWRALSINCVRGMLTNLNKHHLFKFTLRYNLLKNSLENSTKQCT